MNLLKLSPKIDFVFRKLFGSIENKDLLISLINSIVGPALHVVDVIIVNPFNLATYRGSKESILDIKAKDQNGVWYDIEMQYFEHLFYGKRALYYLSKVYVDQLKAGSDYAGLNMTIGIHFLAFNYFDDDRMVRQFVFKDMETNECPEHLSYLRLYFIELGKFRKDWPEVMTALDRWLAFLTKAQLLDRNKLPVELRAEPAIVKAVGELDRMGADPAQRNIYEEEVSARMVDTIQLTSAKDSGRLEGRREGRQEGRQQLLLRQMRRHIGEVPLGIAARIDQLTTDDLDDLGEALFDLGSYPEVEEWLSRRKAN